jgi:hypothetical protein
MRVHTQRRLPERLEGEDEIVSTTPEETRIRVEMTVTEEVTYTFPVTVEVPADIARDRHALRDHLAENEALWLDELPVNGGADVYLYINERAVDEVELPPRTQAA